MGKGFSVPVAHPYPMIYRAAPAPLGEGISQSDYFGFGFTSLNWKPL